MRERKKSTRVMRTLLPGEKTIKMRWKGRLQKKGGFGASQTATFFKAALGGDEETREDDNDYLQKGGDRRLEAGRGGV